MKPLTEYFQTLIGSKKEKQLTTQQVLANNSWKQQRIESIIEDNELKETEQRKQNQQRLVDIVKEYRKNETIVKELPTK